MCCRAIGAFGYSCTHTGVEGFPGFSQHHRIIIYQNYIILNFRIYFVSCTQSVKSHYRSINVKMARGPGCQRRNAAQRHQSKIEKKKLENPSSSRKWSLSGHRATPLVSVALINVSQFFFGTDHGNSVHFFCRNFAPGFTSQQACRSSLRDRVVYAILMVPVSTRARARVRGA